MSLLALLALVSTVPAAEGMWRPDQLDGLAEEAKALGIELDPTALDDLSKAPLGAIVDMEYCSGAFVSPDGLIATAYHCVGAAMQHNSSRGKDLFESGFYATNRKDELWGGPAVKVRVTTAQRDVTNEVFSGTRRLEGAARHERIQANKKSLVRRCESGVGLHCEVVDFDHGTEFQLISQTEIKDLRVVYVPPRNVGYFGGDDDNWQWPRHSGDFAFIRAYAAPDNKPRAYNVDNVPYKPGAFLPPATGPKPGDFVMVAGYPAGTYRWLTASEIEYARDEDYPRKIRSDQGLLKILRGFADEWPEDAAKVSPRILSINNRMSYLKGNLTAFRRIHAVERKWQFENDLARWIVSDETRAVTYAGVLDQLHALAAEESATAERDHLVHEWRRQALMFGTANKLYRLARESRKKDADRASGYQNRDRVAIEASLEALDARYDWRVDQEVMRYYLEQALDLPEGLRIAELDAWFDGLPYKGERSKRIDALMRTLYIENTVLTDPVKRISLMDTSPWYLEKSGNLWFGLSSALFDFFARIEESKAERSSRWGAARKDYMAAIKAFIPIARPRAVAGEEGAAVAPGVFYPDANGTLRVTIGKVDGYYPRDALIAAPRSRLQGILEKSGPFPYDVSDALVAAIERADWGPYGDEALGSVPVNYLSTADTTLGSSGSATINAKGEWCGVLFDGNYESMATDWVFEQALTRSIHTDSSYVLWYLDAVAGADDLLKELGVEPQIEPIKLIEAADLQAPE